ncbi:L10-interacting MYB domain-containing protein [Senna tora]|uniref:L10-interacting MYB domain-containing protein n=1 Tax=Senna tora TaxID=362788 RepID=A0A834SC48_9FABA|nr:L10-interacting MYB domain-containing protein [Senna tora]
MSCNMENGTKAVILMVMVQISYSVLNVLNKLAYTDFGFNMRVALTYRIIFATAFMAPFALFFERWQLVGLQNHKKLHFGPSLWLRIQHRDFSQLLQHTGFGWNAETNTVIVDEEVWSRYILAHSDAAQYKKNGLEHYNLLGIIFNRSTATGVLHHSSTQAPLDSQQERELENEYLYGRIHVDLNEDNQDDITPIERVTHSGKLAFVIPEQKRKRETMTSHMGDAIQAWVKHLEQGQKFNLLNLRF